MPDLQEIIAKETLSKEEKEILQREIALKYVDFVQHWNNHSMCGVNGGKYIMNYDPVTQKYVGKGPFLRLYEEWHKENQNVSLPTFKFHEFLISYLSKELQDQVVIWETVAGPSG